MNLFDRYIAVDWSAANAPKRGKDSIWLAERDGSGRLPSLNPRTRHAAMAHLERRLANAMDAGERTFVGFDFPFGYPSGAAVRLAGEESWSRLWATIADQVEDREDNSSNRFAVAALFNDRLGTDGPRFWGCPASQARPQLSTHKRDGRYDAVAEFRAVERVAKGAKSTWQLFYNGSVGSQSLLGLAQLHKLRSHPLLGEHVAVWPFETEFERRLEAPIVLAEIYPSLSAHDPSVTPKDRAQVEAQVDRFAGLDAQGRLARELSLPEQFQAHRDTILAEEGWIVGAGHAELPA